MSKPTFYGKPMDVTGIEPSPLPWHVGTGRGHHEMIYGNDGSLAAQAHGGHGPFERDANGISDYARREYVNAALVVRAVNSQAALIEACEAARGFIESRPGSYEVWKQLNAAIARARGESEAAS